MTNSEGPQAAADVSIRVLWSPATFVRDVHGQEELDRLAAEVGLEAEAIDEGKAWIGYHQLGEFLAGVRRLVDDDEAFERACTHRIDEAYGLLRYVFMATSPKVVMKLAARTMKIVSAVSRVEVADESRTSLTVKYVSDVPELETDLTCVSRRAQSASIPKLFGFPAATVEHPQCIARGDDACVSTYHFYTRPQHLPVLLGVGLGFVLTWLLVRMSLASSALWVVVPALCGTLGLVWELRRTYRANLAHGEHLQVALQEMAAQEAEARAELLDMHQRQKQWVKLMEEQVAERTASLQDVVKRIRSLGEQRVTSIRGFSHDLRNPLATLRANLEYLAPLLERSDDLAVRDCLQAVDQMDVLLSELAETARTEAPLVRLTPAKVLTEPLVGRLRRRQKALVFGRDIQVSVLSTREAPESITTDPLVFDRIVDNLCTNAAKYTERGSIIIEIDGRPGFLTLKVSDTGRGIPQDAIGSIFLPDRSDPASRAPNSLGLGLSIVTRLVASLGGTLEVMSKVGVGTTFWVHLPVEIAAPPQSFERSAGEVFDDVVTIRNSTMPPPAMDAS